MSSCLYVAVHVYVYIFWKYVIACQVTNLVGYEADGTVAAVERNTGEDLRVAQATILSFCCFILTILVAQRDVKGVID